MLEHRLLHYNVIMVKGMCYSCGFYAWIWSIFLRLEAIEARSDPLPLDEDVMSQSAGGRGTASGLGGEVNLGFFFRWGLFTNHETKTLIGVLFTKNKEIFQLQNCWLVKWVFIILILGEKTSTSLRKKFCTFFFEMFITVYEEKHLKK